jgi:hypothetical protein
MVRLAFYLVIFLLCISCTNHFDSDKEASDSLKSNALFNDIFKKWVSGDFVYTSEKGVYAEIWNKAELNEIKGKGFFTVGVDTLFNMTMRLVDVNGQIKMYYSVTGQNGGKETEFTLTHHDNNQFVFENPFRSFPSVMSYELKGDTAIRIIERGFMQNAEKVEDFVVRKK